MIVFGSVSTLPHPIHHCFGEFLRVIAEKVELHGFGDTEHQVAVQRGFVEDLIDVVAGASDLARQPAHAALVGFQLGLDEMSDMDMVMIAIHDGAKIIREKPLRPIHFIHLVPRVETLLQAKRTASPL